MQRVNKGGSCKSTALAWSLTVVWMLVIFLLSAQPGSQSGSLSMDVTKIIADIAGFIFRLNPEKIADSDQLYMLNGIIREFAHGAAYFILALLAANALKRHGLKGRKLLLLTLSFCAIYAISDEIHQLFVPGRTCELFDLGVDMLGAFCSMALLQLFFFLNRKIIRKA